MLSARSPLALAAEVADGLTVVAAGEGGPEHLLRLFRGIPSPRQPVLIIQRNLPLGFTPYLADLIARAVGCPCRELRDQDALESGAIYFVPSGRHAEVRRNGRKIFVRIYDGEKINGTCPVIDAILASAASLTALRVTAILLGGRGRDGCEGARAVISAGGRVLVQEPHEAPYPDLSNHLRKFVMGAEVASVLAMRAALCAPAPGATTTLAPLPSLPSQWSQIVVVAASTGGPAALLELLDALAPAFIEPILIVQHIPPGFSRRLAESLSAATGRRVEEVAASSPRALTSGQILLAPGDHHLKLVRDGETVRACLDSGAPIDGNRPAADVLFRSAADAVGNKVTAIVLTGTGNDGLIGCAAVAQAGGRVMAQDPRSACAKGMPQAIVGARLAGTIGTPSTLGTLISRQQRNVLPG